MGYFGRRLGFGISYGSPSMGPDLPLKGSELFAPSFAGGI